MTGGEAAPQAANGDQMTRPSTVLGYARHLVLRRGLDRIRPVAYTRARTGIRCLTFHYLFEDEMDRAYALFRSLKAEGDFVTTAQLLALLEQPAKVDARLFHLSIDDGFDNIAANAHAILRDLEIPYTFFVCPDLIDGGAAAEERFRVNAGYRRRLPLASWEKLRILADDGVEIGSHTGSHRRVAALGDDDLDKELVRSKATIECRVGQACSSFAWPFGRIEAMSPAALARARAAGYRAIFSSVRGSLGPGQGIPAYLPRHHFEPSWPERTVLYYATRQERCFKVDQRFAI